jgi:hypothetical protein
MKLSRVAMTLALICIGSQAPAQSGGNPVNVTSGSNVHHPSSIGGQSDRATGLTSSGGASTLNDAHLGAGTETGTAAPNTTGSSGTSGTNGVDASTSNSH